MEARLHPRALRKRKTAPMSRSRSKSRIGRPSKEPPDHHERSAGWWPVLTTGWGQIGQACTKVSRNGPPIHHGEPGTSPKARSPSRSVVVVLVVSGQPGGQTLDRGL